MEIRKQTVNKAPQLVVAAGADFFTINPRNDFTVEITLSDTDPTGDDDVAWIRLGQDQGTSRSIIGDGNLYMRASKDAAVIPLGKDW